VAESVPRIEAVVGPDDRDGWLVSAPYDEGFVAELKAHVRSGDRRWHAEAKNWWVAGEHHGMLVYLLKRFWEEYEVVQEDGSVEIITRSGERIRQGGLF